MDDIPSNDEWITEIEDPTLPVDPSWIEEEAIFDVDAIRNVPIPTYEGGLELLESITHDVVVHHQPPPREPTPPRESIPPREPTPTRESTPEPPIIQYKRGCDDSSSKYKQVI